MTIPNVLTRNKEPAVALSTPKRSMIDGSTAPSVVRTMANVSNPRHAMTKSARRLDMLRSEDAGTRAPGEARRSIQTCIAAKRTGDESHLLHGDRLRPASRLLADAIEKAHGGAEHAATEDNRLGVEETDQIGGCHAPELNRVVDHLQGYGVAAIERLEYVRCRQLGWRH